MSNFAQRLKLNTILNNLKQKPMKTTVLKLSSARNTASQIMPQLSGTKLGYAIQRNDRNISKALNDFYELQIEEQVAVEEATINNASVDDKGILLFTLTKDAQGIEQKVYQYSKEGELKKNSEIRKVQSEYKEKRDVLLYDEQGNEKEVEVELFLANEYPNKFPAALVEVFKGIYLDENSTEKVELLKV